MIDIKHIVCPIDFSVCSGHAFQYAVALARWYEAQITALYVLELFVAPPLSVAYPSREELATRVVSFIKPLKSPDVPVDIAVEEGNVARKIVATANRLPAGLIILGTHGRSGVERLILGSVTEKVLRLAPCPVLVVPRAHVAADEAVTFKRILCPVDFGTSSMRALEYALSLAQETDATLTVLHVLEPIPDDVAVAVPVEVSEHLRLREEDARTRLRSAIPADVQEWCRPVEIIAFGKTHREILRVADETAADLIVMGIAGRGAIDLMLFGSTTNHVIRQAQCPVLTLRDPTGAR